MTAYLRGSLAALLAMLAVATGALAQGAPISFGAGGHDSSQPIEITSDELQIDQAGGFAVFNGNVIVGQGTMRINTGQLRVEYAQNPLTSKTDITRLLASEGVTIVNGQEAAEADAAVYALDSKTIVMTGDVLLTQGPSAISGDKLTYNLETDAGFMEGRVKTILQSGKP